MAALTFNARDVRRVVEHAYGSKKWQVSYFAEDKTPRPQVILVHDDGVYLMSNGQPRDLRDEKTPPRSFAAYAKGLNPDTDKDVWEAARAAVGGDDFSEFLDFGDEMVELIRSPYFHQLVIKVTADQLEVFVEQRQPRKRRAGR